MMSCLETPSPKTPPPATRERLQRYHTTAPGSAAEDALVREWVPLVRTVVGRLAMTLPPHVEMDDLYSAGLVGLLNGVRNYDPEGGSSFESYARVRIRGAVLDELRRMDWVPRSVHDKARKVQTAISDLEQKLGRPPTEGETARAMNLSPAEYDSLLDEIRPATFVCLDAAQNNEDANSLRHESIPDDTQEPPDALASRHELSKVIAQKLEQLPEMQRKVLALYYFEDLRLREIATVFGVTESRICQIHSQAILAIKAALKKKENPKP